MYRFHDAPLSGYGSESGRLLLLILLVLKTSLNRPEVEGIRFGFYPSQIFRLCNRYEAGGVGCEATQARLASKTEVARGLGMWAYHIARMTLFKEKKKVSGRVSFR